MSRPGQHMIVGTALLCLGALLVLVSIIFAVDMIWVDRVR